MTGNVSGLLKATLLHWGRHHSQGCCEGGWGQKQRICAATSSEWCGRVHGDPFIPGKTAKVHSKLLESAASSLQSQSFKHTLRSTGSEANPRVWTQVCTPFSTSCSCSRVTNGSIKPVMFPLCCFITWARVNGGQVSLQSDPIRSEHTLRRSLWEPQESTLQWAVGCLHGAECKDMEHGDDVHEKHFQRYFMFQWESL